ncbi:MAG: tetratricopeptide repeat protein [Oceanicaulis sp.]
MIKSVFIAAALAAQPAGADPVDALEQRLQAGETEGPQFQSALDAVRAAAEAGDAQAMHMLGWLIIAGYVEAQPETARTWFERAIEAGEPALAEQATVDLAFSYYGQSDTPERGRALLQALEDAGPAKARRDAFLGYDLLVGVGGEPDPAYGQALINGALARGFSEVWLIESAGDFWNQREDGVQDALRMYDEATRRGSASAAWRYAMIVLRDGGDPADAWRYVAWSSEQGYEDAMISRAVMLATGQGVDADPAAARDWYARAARRGSAHGARGLGAMLLTGEGGPADPARGYALLELAAAGEDPVAGQWLEEPPRSAAARPGADAVAAARQAFLSEAGLTADDFR